MASDGKRSRAPGHEVQDTIPASLSGIPEPRLELTVIREAGEVASRTVAVDSDVFRVGSHESNDLALADGRVSRFHCRIVRDARAWRLEDAGSLNGIEVNGIRVRDADLLMPECTLVIGQSTVVVREVASGLRVAHAPRVCLGALYGRAAPMLKLFAMVERVAKTDATVLVEGESGTGKELVAAELVAGGARADKPFVVVDCGAISPSLIESHLFGHARGAFTGADRDRVGAFEAANGGTLFLDEIGEMPLEMQPKLLRALQAREVCRIGETQTRKVDVRVIAATNRRLEREVNRGGFREDLFFRLAVVTLRVPPLRERVEDLDILVDVFLDALGATSKRGLFTRDVRDQMARHDWPGNVRELRNYVERVVVLHGAQPFASGDDAPEERAQAEPIDLDVPFNEAKQLLVGDFERRYVAALLEWSGGNLSRAARRARMDRMNLHRLVQLHGLRPPRSLRD